MMLMIVMIEALPLADSGREFWENEYYYYLWKPLMAIVIAGTIVAAERGSGLLQMVLSLKPVVFLGKISYSFYLWHLPIFVSIARYGNEIGWVAQWSIGFLLTFLVATISERIFERPFLSGRPAKKHKAPGNSNVDQVPN
jgi:peptidoglycan/LPS O-acetylase OafA/YrhL